jgi:hypothetical protein
MGICLYEREARSSENGPPPVAAGAAAAQAPRVSVHSGRTSWHRRQGPAAAHSRPITRRTDRTEPIEPRPTPDPAFSLPSLLPIPRPPYPGLPPRRLDGRATDLTAHTNPRITPAPAPLPPRRPRPNSTSLGKPAPHLPGTSRKGGQRNVLAPLSRKPRREAKEAPGGGAAARSRLRRTPRNEHQETNTKRRTGRGDRAIEITRKEKPERFRDGVNRSAALMGEEHSARMSAVRLALVPSNRLVSMDLVPACPLDW